MSYNATNPPPGIDPDTWNKLLHIREGCYPDLVPGVRTDYGYRPTLAAGIVFCALFGIALIGHTIQIGRFRRWTSILFAIGATTEAIGWAGRTWSAKCPYNHNAFLMQITTLIIAPTFFAAGLYVLLGTLITKLGRETSALSPAAYAIVFCSCDVVSLVVQAVGGALASNESGKIDGNTKPGTNIMVAGIAFQLATMTLFAALVLDFLRRVRRRTLSRAVKMVLLALAVSFVMIYIRSIYRTVELAQGWTGYLIEREGFFVGLDAALMFVAVGIFLIFDPAYLLRPQPARQSTDSAPSGDESKASATRSSN